MVTAQRVHRCGCRVVGLDARLLTRPPFEAKCGRRRPFRDTISTMAAVVVLRPLDDSGDELLDQLELRTEMTPDETFDDGGRSYYLSAQAAGADAFNVMLDEIDPSWREHLTRTPERD